MDLFDGHGGRAAKAFPARLACGRVLARAYRPDAPIVVAMQLSEKMSAGSGATARCLCCRVVNAELNELVDGWDAQVWLPRHWSLLAEELGGGPADHYRSAGRPALYAFSTRSR
ncbi:hypothetical protein [Nocardia abscessus]|uniref:hypothetical protein n=1 Tax=Nocardia abscessus TaxID=120957 RepID=UPI002456240B|nr:hypothetical protein [Nocardia abscessus]